MTTHLIATSASPDDFRQRLQRELAARCGRNARYSLRAFANFLDIDHATLSQLMRGKRPMSAQMVKRLGARIGLDVAEIAHYAAVPAAAGQPAVRALAGDAAEVLSQWQPFAILELMRLKEFRTDVRWIARMLGASTEEVQVALQHLLRLEFLRMEAPGRWVDLTGGAIHREEDFTLAALERLAARSRELQLASARNAPEGQRMHGAATIALRRSDIPRLLALAEHFLSEARGCASPDAADQLYHLDIHCIPLTIEKEN